LSGHYGLLPNRSGDSRRLCSPFPIATLDRHRTLRAAFVRQTASGVGRRARRLRPPSGAPAAIARAGGSPTFPAGENMLATTRQRFLDDYIKIRHAEGRGSPDSAYYLALPYRDLTGRLEDQWTIRARSYRYLERHVLPPVEKRFGRPLRIADLGAGNCWLSYRLALRGHLPIAIDIHGDPLDGLGAGLHYQQRAAFPRVSAEFDDLPLAAGSLDVAIYNA